jgi:hypothetical protein
MRAHGQLPSHARILAAMALLIPLAVVATACSSSAAPSTGLSSPAAVATAPRGAADAAPVGAPGAVGAVAPVPGGNATTGSEVSGGGTASNAAISYPYPGIVGTSGVAADHTIVVTGIGDAPLKADGSNRATAQHAALAAALADARAQADLVAETTGVTIHGVLSVSVSSGQTYAYPLAAGVEGATPGASSGGTTITPPAPAVVEPAAPRFEVSVTVAYQIG